LQSSILSQTRKRGVGGKKKRKTFPPRKRLLMLFLEYQERKKGSFLRRFIFQAKDRRESTNQKVWNNPWRKGLRPLPVTKGAGHLQEKKIKSAA